jgi:hypothetical protein
MNKVKKMKEWFIKKKENSKFFRINTQTSINEGQKKIEKL